MHHEIFKVVFEVNGVLWLLNYTFLMFISSLPFYAELMATFISASSSVYYVGALCVGMILMGSFQLSVWLYVLYNRHKHEHSSELFTQRLLTVLTLALSTTPLVAALAYFVSLIFSADYAIWVLCLIPVIVVSLFALFGVSWDSLSHANQPHVIHTPVHIETETTSLLSAAHESPSPAQQSSASDGDASTKNKRL
jgi:uncharacterized membrane protein